MLLHGTTGEDDPAGSCLASAVRVLAGSGEHLGSSPERRARGPLRRSGLTAIRARVSAVVFATSAAYVVGTGPLQLQRRRA